MAKFNPLAGIAQIDKLFRDLDKLDALYEDADDQEELTPYATPFPEYEYDPLGFTRDILKIKLITPEVEEIGAKLLEQRLINVQAAHSVGKCLSPHDTLTLADGREIKAKDLVGTEFKLPTLDSSGKLVIANARASWNKHEYIYEIETIYGNKITRNSHHPLQTAIKWSKPGAHPIIKTQGWRGIGEIESYLTNPPTFENSKFMRNDASPICEERDHSVMVAMTKELSVFGETELPKELLNFVAYMIGDGCLTSTLSFSQSDNPVLEEWKQSVSFLGDTYSKRKGDNVDYGISGGNCRKLLKSLSLLGKNSYHKEIPSEFFTLKKDLLAHFLNRLFSTDGWVTTSETTCKSGHTNYRTEIGYCSVNEALVRQIQRLLVRFGIHGQVRRKDVSGQLDPNYKAWVLDIHAVPEQITFLEQIGVYGRQEQIEKVLPIIKRRSHSNQIRKYRTDKSPKGTYWQEVRSITRLPDKVTTVAVEVDEYHTYCTDFYEHNTYSHPWWVLWCILAWGGQAIVTAPTNNQVQLVWNYLYAYELPIRQALQARGVPKADWLRFLTTELKVGRVRWSWGFSPQNYSVDSFQGIHAQRLLIIVDEACSITPQIYDGANSCVAGDENIMLSSGNPVIPNTTFHKMCKRDHIKIPVWTHPNVSWAYELDPESGYHQLKPEVATAIALKDGECLPQSEWPPELPRDKYPGAVTISWIEDKRFAHGEGSPYWENRLEANFTQDAGYSVIPMSYLTLATQLDPFEADRWRIGCDIGDGGDPHALTICHGDNLIDCREVQSTQDINDQKELAKVIAKICYYILEHDSYGNEAWRHEFDLEKAYDRFNFNQFDQFLEVRVDAIGVGATMAGMLYDYHIPAVEIKWSEAVEDEKDKKQFANTKIQQFWHLRMLLKNSKVFIADEFTRSGQRTKLFEELSGCYYETQQHTNRLIMERKEKTIERIGHSPNMADSCIMAFAPYQKGVQKTRQALEALTEKVDTNDLFE